MPVVISPEAVALAERLGTDVYWAVECGLHSGFPPCCVTHWTLCMREAPVQTHESYRKFINRNYHGPMQYGPGYVPCPACVLAGNFVSVMDCQCHRYRTYRLPSRRLPVQACA